jgi:opacity protein-like surface antigen
MGQLSSRDKTSAQVDWELTATQFAVVGSTEVATRVGDDIFGRVLFDAQGDYANRYWRPINISHNADTNDHVLILRQLEGKIKKENWYVNGYAGVGHGDWYGQGDFFRLYPESFPDSSYVGSSGYFGVYPDNWNEDQYLNISRRNVPRGFEAGADVHQFNATVAYGDEIAWGVNQSGYARVGMPFSQNRLTFVAKSEDISEDILNKNARRQAYALSWDQPFESGHRLGVGVLYQPYRDGERYLSIKNGGSISSKTAKESDGFGEKVRFDYKPVIGERLFITAIEVQHLGILAGNKEQLDLLLGTNLTSSFHFDTQYMYRRPVEDPIPFRYEGTPSNIGNVVSNPRGPESPFTVDWTNREAVSLLTTFWYDPTTDTNFFLYDPHRLEGWNVNKKENAGFSVALQHRMTDYRSTTDRQTYFDERGELHWESAAHSGAWPSDGFLHEFRILGRGKTRSCGWMLGVAGGQSPAMSGLAYSNDPSQEKPITEYISFEGRLELARTAFWAHYGSGVWGPEVNIHPFFGLAFDRLFGAGVSYNITTNTTWDIGYLAARQDDSLFVAPDLGSYDEIRTVLSHRFGFQLQFEEF